MFTYMTGMKSTAYWNVAQETLGIQPKQTDYWSLIDFHSKQDIT